MTARVVAITKINICGEYKYETKATPLTTVSITYSKEESTHDGIAGKLGRIPNTIFRKPLIIDSKNSTITRLFLS